jgi:hypothetical protein
MLDITKTKQEFYESQSKEQLIIFLNNQEYKEEILREKLFMLSGCRNFGGPDGMNGTCIECFHENRSLHDRCYYFSCALDDYRRKKLMEKKNELSQ